MSRPLRFDFQGAIHLVTLAGSREGKAFYDPHILKLYPCRPRGHAPDAEFFENLLWETCTQYGAQVHAYVLEPNTALFITQTMGAPLAWIMHDLIARYSIYWREQRPRSQTVRPFQGRYKAQIVQPAKLPYAVRYVQRRDFAGDRHRRAINHPFSSSLIYCGRRPQPDCFVVSATQKALSGLGHVAATSYFEFMGASDSPAIMELLSRRVIGEHAFAANVTIRCHEPRATPSPDEILREVTGTLLHTDSGIVCSSSHLGALARALVAWYAMRTGAAQIGTVAGWFGVTSSNLRYLIHRHRQTHSQYFTWRLAELFPMLGPVRSASALLLPTPPRAAEPGDRRKRCPQSTRATVIPTGA